MAKIFDETKEGLKCLFYAQPGAGKTTLLGTACDDPRFGKVLDLNAYGNPQALRGRPVDKRPDIITMETMEDFNDPYDWLINGQDPKAWYAKEFKLDPPYKTLFIDSTTEVQRFIASIINASASLAPGSLVGALGRQGFGTLFGTMMHWSKSMLDLTQPPHSLNVIFMAHEASKQDENQRMYFEPLIWGQGGLELCGYALLVGRLTVQKRIDGDIKVEDNSVLNDDVFNVLQIRPTTRSYAKDQYDMGTSHIINPTMSKVMDLIERSSPQP
jgi:hypothetical protein